MQRGQATQAARYYAQALESDGLPVRMTAPWRQKVAEVARRHAIPVLDADAILRPHTKSGILDRSVFLDYVHPNLRGYYDLGMAASERIASDRSWRNSSANRKHRVTPISLLPSPGPISRRKTWHSPIGARRKPTAG